MSLGDGLARSLAKYQRAKTHFGLQRLLLGQFDPEELDRVRRGLATTPQHTTASQEVAKTNGSGTHSNGASNGGSSNGTNGNHRLTEPADQTSVGAAESVEVAHANNNSLGEKSLGEQRSQQEQFKVICPECQGALQYTEGCCMCHSCGYALC